MSNQAKNPAASPDQDILVGDEEIATVVRLALKWSVLIPDAQIRSTVSAGVVTLEGEVYYPSQRQDAERAIRNLARVREVRNLIQVCPSKVVDDVHSAIVRALDRHAEREVRNIDLTVRDGVVTLRGRVQSWAEKQLVLGAARGTAGVRHVEDALHIVS